MTTELPTARRSWVRLDLGLLALALVLAVVLLVTWGDDAQAGPDLDDATAAASAEQRGATRAAGRAAVAFLEVDHRDMDAVVERVLDGATGSFAEEYAADRDRLTTSVERRQAVVEASLRAVGARDADGGPSSGTMVVLVAADSVLRDDATAEEGVLRRHRLELTMTRDDDAWLVAGLEFVR